MREMPACAGLCDIMFPDEENGAATYALDVAFAKAICAECPSGVKMDCLVGALERDERYGVWGGVDMATERWSLIEMIKGQAA